MASIVLSTVGSAVGSAGAPAGSIFGSKLGQALGGKLDELLLPGRKLAPLRGPRLAELGVQTSTYGKMIPVVYGNMRIAGNIIWAQAIQEAATTTTSSAGGGGKGGGGRVSQSTTTYAYSVTLAIAICEGPVDDILRIWADAKQLDLSQFTVRLYRGDEEQLADSLIQAVEGAERTPAFRGLAYAVFENFPLGDYGNRIPNFTFEVQKKTLQPDYDGELLEDVLTGVVMIPGAGEFVYDTQMNAKVPGVAIGDDWAQQGNQQPVNAHTPYGKANALVALDQLGQTCPNVEWVSVVVGWFGTSMDAGACLLLPGVEFQGGAVVSPLDWAVAGYGRATAHLIGNDDGMLRYGGTPDDASLLRYVAELRGRGYQVAFYPLVFMDVPGKPWRGHVTGNAGDVAEFFSKEQGYNAYVMHYANLLAGKVDAFIIGSELKGLTKISDSPGHYPAVDALVGLAGMVKAVLGTDVTVTYAADWSEYHHTDGGWYNLDPLWACADIDVIGIDAYFPLSDSPQSGYDIAALIAGWDSGEGYDWYYSDSERSVQASLDAPYAWKNLGWFWGHVHVNPNGSPTAWAPQMKKIWFTEFGFPSVDGAANQPNVFYSASSSSSAFPYHSRGRVDFLAQRTALMATLQKWKGSAMVERMFAWAWDARPFPYWPDLLHVWSDGVDWRTGHWLQGKLGTSSLAAVVRDLCRRAGLEAAQVDVARLHDQLEGFVISTPQTARGAIETLQTAYFFDAVESASQIKFVSRGGESLLSLVEDALAMPEGDAPPLGIVRAQELELPRRVNAVYLSRMQNYQAAMRYAERQVTESLDNLTLDLPVVCDDQQAQRIADITLYSLWVGRTSYRFELPVRYAQLEPADVLTINRDGILHRMRVVGTRFLTPSVMQVDAVADDVACFDLFGSHAVSVPRMVENVAVPGTVLQFLDIPAMPGDGPDRGMLRVALAGTGGGWGGAALYRSDDAGASYGRLLDVSQPAVMGTALQALPAGVTQLMDEASQVDVVLLGKGELQSVTPLALLNGGNAALLGQEMIQFAQATLLEAGKYRLSGLLRGRLGTEWAVGSHGAGERFVLLDAAVARLAVPHNLIGLSRPYKAVSFGGSLPATAPQELTYGAVALRPYSPVHVQGTRDGDGTISLSWVRRSRAAGWQDGIDAPLNEYAEHYEVDILDEDGEVMRTLAGLAAPQAVYAAAEQVADFGSVQALLALRVYQVSAQVGRGYPAQASV